MKKTLYIIALVLIVVCSITPFANKDSFLSYKTDKTKNDLILNHMNSHGELLTCELNITDCFNCNDFEINTLNKDSVICLYDATVTTGIDINDIKLNNIDHVTKQIEISVPRINRFYNISLDDISFKAKGKEDKPIYLNLEKDYNRIYENISNNIIDFSLKSDVSAQAERNTQKVITNIIKKQLHEYDCTVSFV